MLPPLKVRHLGRLRTEVFRVPSTLFTSPLASMVGRRLFSVSQYSVEPVPRDLIPSISGSKPQVLWLGCSDSGYEETTILDLIPEEMIVVRNCGNMALENDLSWSSAVQYAVNNLQVNHIIVCGHYGCRLVKPDPIATASEYPWQRKLSSLQSSHQHQLQCHEAHDRNRYMLQANVVEQMNLVRETLGFINPEEQRRIMIHGFIYDRMRHRAERIVIEH